MSGNDVRAASRSNAHELIERVEARRRTHPAAAWDLLSAGFEDALRGQDAGVRGQLWRLHGHVPRSLRRLQPAAQAYRRAESWFGRAGLRAEMGSCAIGLVDTLMYLGRYREAERVAARGRRVLRRAKDRGAEARLLNNEGNLHHRLDRPDRALDRYRAARKALGRMGDPRARTLVEANIANCLSLLGRTAEARRLYRAARGAHAKAGEEVVALRAEYNLAYLDFLEHRHERALDRLEAIRDDARARGVPSIEALTALDRSEVLLRLGDHGGALEEATAAAAAFAGLAMTYERAKAETFAALAEFRLGRRRSARNRLERTLAAFLDEGNAVWAGEALVGLATLLWADDNPEAAAPLLRAAARRFAGARDREREGCALALLARARIESGDRRASAPLDRARRLSRGGSVRLRHLTRMASAELERRRGNHASARRHLRRAADDSERLAARILDEQWRASFWGDWGRPHQDLAALEVKAGNAEAAFEALERGRGRALASPWRTGRRDSGAVASVRSWAASRLARDRDRTTRSATLDVASPERASPTAAAVRRALRRRVGPDAIRARELRAALSPDSMLLDYAELDGELAGFALSRSETILRPSMASGTELSRRVHEVLFDLRRAAMADVGSRPSAESLESGLAEIASLVLWPLIGSRAPRELLVIPSRALARLPWAALPLPDGRPLCAATELVLVPGLRLGLKGAPLHGRSGKPLIVASSAEGLENVSAEAALVRAALPGARTLSGPSARADAFLESAPEASWIHFAGHGIYQAGHSGLRFADRWLLAEEVSGLRLGAQAVVLSACQSARALVQPGDEWFGLARALLLAGAGAVLAAQWDVQDATATRFMSEVYGLLGRGEPLAAAVTGAQMNAMREGQHVLDWAGFVLLGGPEAGARNLNGYGNVKNAW